MFVCILNVFNVVQVVVLCDLFDNVGDVWVDGCVLVGYLGVLVKVNQQIDEGVEVVLQCQQFILSVLEWYLCFISVVLLNVVYLFMFNCYGEGMIFGVYVDGSVCIYLYNGIKLCIDILVMLFLLDFVSYDGGELQIEDMYGMYSVKFNVGDLVIYLVMSLYQVMFIMCGVCVVSFFWIQSLICDDVQCVMLFDLDNVIQMFNQIDVDVIVCCMFIGVYYNLMWQWSEI